MTHDAEVPAARSGLGGVLGVALGLTVLAACMLVPFFYGASSFAAEPSLRASFDLGALPFGFALEERGHVLPGGERVFVFGDGTQPVEDALDAAAESAEASAEGSAQEAATDPQEGESNFEDRFNFDWSAIEVLSTDTPPQQLFLVHYPSARAESVIAEHFRQLLWKDLRWIEAKGGRSAVDGGKLTWGEYAADYVRERTYIEGGAFRDTLRVNLSLGRECWIAYALWPTQHAGSEQPVSELLACLRPAAPKPIAQ